MAMRTHEAAEKWGISPRRVRVLCVNRQVDGAWREGKIWYIPNNTPKPADGRIRNKKTLIAQIIRKKVELETLRPLTEGETARLLEDFLIEYTYNSNAIEGNTLTLRETDMVLKGLTIDQKPLKDHMEAVGHKEAFNYVCDLVKNCVPLSEMVIKQIHTLVLPDKPMDRGVYRRVPVRAMVGKNEPAQPDMIEPKMAELMEKYATDERSIVEKLADLHIAFETIQPFIDGNGRTGRLIVNLELMKAGYPPIDIKFTDCIRYYDAFESHDEMTKLFCEYLCKRLDQHLDAFE